MAVRQWLVQVGQRLLDFVYPLHCAGCDRLGEAFCVSCRDSVPRVIPPVCPSCGMPAPDSSLCARCQTHPLQIDGIRSVVFFEEPLRQAIHRLKYAAARDMAKPFAEMMTQFWHGTPLPADVIVPVPLHPHRQRERGYNQSALLAWAFGGIVGLPVWDRILFRRRNTVSQTTLDAGQRRVNVAGAFECEPTAVQDRQVLLIDDVCTTGATLEACSAALKAGGARSVWALTLARAK